uniref:Uncharacterized protein n=1 Tax=Amphimedon queenslandica TaxID=400682 RepID=A0A1X7VPG1_AMPQE
MLTSCRVQEVQWLVSIFFYPSSSTFSTSFSLSLTALRVKT